MKHLLFIAMCLSFYTANSQDLSQRVINANGKFITGSTCSLEYSFGEIAVATVTGNGFILTQGFLQPNDYNTEIDEKETSEFAIYPNPVENQLTIVGETTDKQLYIYGLDGKQMVSYPLNTQQISVENLPAGIYLLQLKNKAGKSVLNKKIVKL